MRGAGRTLAAHCVLRMRRICVEIVGAVPGSELQLGQNVAIERPVDRSGTVSRIGLLSLPAAVMGARRPVVRADYGWLLVRV